MQAANQSCFSDKDIELLKKTFRRAAECFYDNPKNEAGICDLQHVCAVIQEVIGTKKQANSLSILSQLETLLIKSKNHPDLMEKVSRTIAHLKMPTQVRIQFSTVEYALQKSELFTLGCTILLRQYKELQTARRDIDYKAIISAMSANCTMNPSLCVQLLCCICSDNEQHSKTVIKSGLVKYIFSAYIPLTLEDKYNLYKAVKLIKIIAKTEKTVLREREKALALVVFTYEDYATVVEDICAKCFDQEYCTQIDNKGQYDALNIDQPYFWSHSEAYCTKCLSKKTVDWLVKSREGQLSAESQSKTLAILANYVKFNKVPDKRMLSLPKHYQSMLNYGKLCINISELDSTAVLSINFQGAMKLIERQKSAKVDQMFQSLKQMCNKDVKVGQLNQSMRSMFCLQRNADFLLQRATRIPMNNEQLEDIRRILAEKARTGQFEADTLNSIKQKALASLLTGITMRKPLNLNIVLASMQLDDVLLVARILQILQLHMMMQEESIETINFSRISEIVEWLVENYRGEIIDWGSIGQLLIVLKNEKEWLKYVDHIEQKCYWLLAILDPTEQEEDRLFERLAKLNELPDRLKVPHLNLVVGFLGKALSRQARIDVITEHRNLLEVVERGIRSNNDFKTSMLMMAMFLKDWHDDSTSETAEADNAVFEKYISPLLEFVLNNFRDTEQEYEFLQSCLPLRVSLPHLADRLDILVEHYGKLASHVYQNSNRRNLNSSMINLSTRSLQQSQEMLEILTFLEDKREVLHSSQLADLMGNLLRQKNIYWRVYPNFVSLLSKILAIVCKKSNGRNSENATSVITSVIEHLLKTNDMSESQKEEIYMQTKKELQGMSERGVWIQIEKVRRVVTKIVEEQIREQIIVVLNGYKIKEKGDQQEKADKPKQESAGHKTEVRPKEQDKKKLVVAASQASLVPQKTKTEYIEPTPNAVSGSFSEFQVIERSYRTKAQTEQKADSWAVVKDRQQPMKPQNSKAYTQVHEQLEKQEAVTDIDDNIRSLQSEGDKIDKNLLWALLELHRIMTKAVDMQNFDKAIDIVLANQLNFKQKDIFGHLLANIYSIESKPVILELLLRKDKANLSRETCYELLSKHKEAFVLAQRWKLSGRDWLDLSVKRLREGFFASACQVIEYNLLKMADIEHFHSQKHHEQITACNTLLSTQEQTTNYFLLVGTSARMSQVKKFYIEHNIHQLLMPMIQKYSQALKVVANGSYALSSLVYLQPEICLDIVKHKSEMRKLIEGYRLFFSSKPVVESGACLIANLAYSNEEVKELLRQYSVVQVLIFIFESSLIDAELSTFKHLLRAFGNLSLSPKCTQEIIDQHFCAMAVRMVQQLDIFVHYDDKKARLMKILIDLVANLSAHKYKLEIIHREKITLLILTLLETTETNAGILMSCIDTIDGLCQNPEIESYAVSAKKLPYILIDILKIQEDEKIIVKSTRLLTNLTINSLCIPFILEANLLSVLANIVMPTFYGNRLEKEQSRKMETYVFKILTRIYNSRQSIALILKSGYLDCLVRTIQTCETLEDSYIDILQYYAQHLPSFLNKRAFMALIRVLTRKLNNNEVVQKCMNVFKTLLSYSYDKEEEDLVIEGVTTMYEHLLDTFTADTLHLLAYHCMRSYRLRALLRKKECKIQQIVHKYSKDEHYSEVCRLTVFLILNQEEPILFTIAQDSNKSYQFMREGVICKLYRINGSSKKAKIDLDEEYNIRAYKYPDGEVKKKYCCSLRYVRDLQFHFSDSDELWQASPFSAEKGLFDSNRVPPQLCASIVGSARWGEICFINVQFEKMEDKNQFFKAFCNLLHVFR